MLAKIKRVKTCMFDVSVAQCHPSILNRPGLGGHLVRETNSAWLRQETGSADGSGQFCRTATEWGKCEMKFRQLAWLAADIQAAAAGCGCK